MKKTLSIVLALVLVLSLSAFAFAETVSSTGDTEKNVTANIVAASTSVTHVYSVELNWTDITALVYNAGTTAYKWNPATLKYEADAANNVAAAWTTNNTSFTITVKNSSDAAITATAAYDDGSDAVVTTCAFTDSKNSVDCDSAAKDIDNYTNTSAIGAITTGTISGTVTVTGGSIAASGTVVGTITITLAPKA